MARAGRTCAILSAPTAGGRAARGASPSASLPGWHSSDPSDVNDRSRPAGGGRLRLRDRSVALPRVAEGGGERRYGRTENGRLEVHHDTADRVRGPAEHVGGHRDEAAREMGGPWSRRADQGDRERRRRTA